VAGEDVMSKIILIRHGHADYDCLHSRKFPIDCSGLAPLTSKGINQAMAIVNDERLNDAELIVSSPYTRALQTAAIISNVKGLKINVEFDLHEWLPDTSFKIEDESQFYTALHSFRKNDGLYHGQAFLWEQISDIKKRVLGCLSQYSNYRKIVVVTHGEVIYCLTGQKCTENCGISEMELP